MARRKKTTTRYRTRTVYRRARSSIGSTKGIIDGAIAGAVSSIAEGFFGGWGSVIGTLATGYFMKNNTLKTIGGFQLGDMIGDMIHPGKPGSGNIFE